MAADLQVSGEAMYTDDIKHSSDALVAALVTSTRPHARLVRWVVRAAGTSGSDGSSGQRERESKGGGWLVATVPV